MQFVNDFSQFSQARRQIGSKHTHTHAIGGLGKTGSGKCRGKAKEK